MNFLSVKILFITIFVFAITPFSNDYFVAVVIGILGSIVGIAFNKKYIRETWFEGFVMAVASLILPLLVGEAVQEAVSYYHVEIPIRFEFLFRLILGMFSFDTIKMIMENRRSFITKAGKIAENKVLDTLNLKVKSEGDDDRHNSNK